MDCIAEIALVGGSLESALITKFEKAQKSPAIIPLPSAADIRIDWASVVTN